MIHSSRRLAAARPHRATAAVLAFLLSPVFTTIAAAADHPAPSASDKAVTELQGQWQPVSIEIDGQKLDSAGLKDQRVFIKGDEMTTTPANDIVKIKLNPGKTPAEIDFTGIAGPGKGKTAGGIYSLQNGQLTLCIPADTQRPVPRPKEFKTQKGDGLVLIILKRPPPPPTPGDVRNMS
jgi:uncharacterized protein (TIGR03067 family)